MCTTTAIGTGVSRIVLVDDHEVVRAGLRSLIESEDDLVVVGEAGTAEEGVCSVQDDPPDLVVMDVRLPDRSGIAACREIIKRHPEVRVLILTSHADDGALLEAMDSGASGYVLKRVKMGALVDTIRHVLDGHAVFERDWVNPPDGSRLDGLSPQERNVAGYLGEGLTNREIAQRMGLAEKTVKNYVSNVLMKMEMSHRSEAAAYIARAGVIRGDLPRYSPVPRSTLQASNTNSAPF